MLNVMIGHALHEARLSKGLTLRALAARVPMSYSGLSEIEKGKKPPTSELIWGIAKALGIPLSTILAEASDLLAAAEKGGANAA